MVSGRRRYEFRFMNMICGRMIGRLRPENRLLAECSFESRSGDAKFLQTAAQRRWTPHQHIGAGHIGAGHHTNTSESWSLARDSFFRKESSTGSTRLIHLRMTRMNLLPLTLVYGFRLLELVPHLTSFTLPSTLKEASSKVYSTRPAFRPIIYRFICLI